MYLATPATLFAAAWPTLHYPPDSVAWFHSLASWPGPSH